MFPALTTTTLGLNPTLPFEYLTDVAGLVDRNLAIGPRDPHSKQMHQFAEVLHLEFRSQLHLHNGNISSVLSCNKQIVHAKSNVSISFGIDIKAGFCIGSNEADFAWIF